MESETCQWCEGPKGECDRKCPANPNYDPTPWCTYHGNREACDCEKYAAEND
jgi:hypothetical protein